MLKLYHLDDEGTDYYYASEGADGALAAHRELMGSWGRDPHDAQLDRVAIEPMPDYVDVTLGGITRPAVDWAELSGPGFIHFGKRVEK